MPKGSASPATVAEVADWLGISSRRVRELRADGVLPGEPNEPYDLRECVRAYCTHIRPAAGKAASGGSEGAADLDQNKARESLLRGDRLELIVKQMRAELIPAGEMEHVVGAVFDVVRTKTLAVPSRAAPLLVGLKTTLEIQEKLTEIVHEVCGGLAATEAVATIKDRARRRAGRAAPDDAGDEEAGPTT
jgi:hypothetical protein